MLHETPADEIMRVGTRWRSTTEDKGFQSAPSPISLFRHRVQSTVVLGNDQRSATETLRIEEAFEMRDGRRYRCVAQAQIPLALRYGRKQGEAAVELGRPALELTRHCNPPGFPELELTMPATAARFVMRADQLIAVEPPLEKRVYLPTP